MMVYYISFFKIHESYPSLKTITKNQKYKKIKKYVLNFMERVIQIV